MDALEHAYVHSREGQAADQAQIVLSLDFAIEMLLKAALLNRGQSIMASNGRSVGIFDAMKRVKTPKTYLDAPSIEVLHERRNSLQHFASYVDSAALSDLYETAVRFAAEAVVELGELLPADVKLPPRLAKIPELAGLGFLFESEFVQRDVTAHGEVVAWAQGEADSTNLGIWVKRGTNVPVRLTPQGLFEYMPRTDGTRVVAYRQSGGVVLYDLQTGSRSIVSESGGPTDIDGDVVATQGGLFTRRIFD